MLVQVSDQALRGWDQSEETFLGRALRRQGWLGDRLRDF
jgi:hypothetical protein